MRQLAGTPAGVWVTCIGRSMEPTIKRGDRVRVRADRPVGVGDIALFQAPRGHVLHRVVWAMPGVPWLVHVGDAGTEDQPSLAHRSTVIGRADLPRHAPSLAALGQGWQRVGQALVHRLAVLSRRLPLRP